MKESIQEFVKSKDFLVCVDSDGCAMDTMDVKHIKSFGPKAVEVWGLESIKDEFMKVWLDANLYTRTRGINRFAGLVLAFDIMAEKGYDVPDLSAVKKWVETTNELSAPSLEREIDKNNDEQLKKALEWSNLVNKSIKEDLVGEDRPFPNAKEGLAAIANVADVAIVSSANGSAVREEWTRHGLAEHVDIMCGQEAGTKAYCIEKLKEKRQLQY